MKIFTTRRFALLLFVLLFLGLSLEVRGQYVVIPDANFRDFLQAQYPACFNGSGEMDTTCADIVNEDYLNVNGLGISNLDGIQYFDHLIGFQCSFNSISILPSLPQTLVFFTCLNNNLTSLPALPHNLQLLGCGSNYLNSLPALPSSLRNLYCQSNNLVQLPSLPYLRGHSIY